MSKQKRTVGILTLVLCVLLALTSGSSATLIPDEAPNGSSSPDRDCAAIFEEYQSELEKLAKKCDELDMSLEARVTRSLLFHEQENRYIVPLLPSKTGLQKLPDDATKNQRFWFSRLRKLRTQYAGEAWNRAERLGQKKRGYEVVATILTALYIDPDHARSRQFFGYVLKDGEWRSRWELKQLENGLVEDPVFGWLPTDRVERYRKGERYYRGEWIAAEEERERILSGSSGWRVETEHFSILSRVSLERGVEIGRFLEYYYEAWSRLFYRFIASENQWCARLSASQDSGIVPKRHKVILYQNREEYRRELLRHDANAGLSTGGYFPGLRCIFTYEPGPDDEFDLFPLLAHEATHQLFDECNIANSSRGKTDFSKRAQHANFWMIEGIAVYAETFRLNPRSGQATLGGGAESFRVQCALESLFEDGSYVRLAEYAGLSREQFQNHPDVPLLYSEAAGLAQFFMHYDGGIYRDSFVNALYTVYQGRDGPNLLELATGKTFAELDKEYEEYMSGLTPSR